ACAFLVWGGAVAVVGRERARARAGAGTLALSLGAALGCYALVGAVFGGVAESPAILTLGAIFIMGTFVFLAAASGQRKVFVRAGGIAFVASISYFTVQTAAAALLGNVVPAPPEPGLAGMAVMILAVVSFAAVALAQTLSPDGSARMASAVYVHAANGFYANALFNRIIGALRIRSHTLR
ncbi:MAG: oxidoreductase, partial [Hyphococcus sp.]